MMSVQRSGVFHIPRLATWLARDPESLSTIDNEICLEKVHFARLWQAGTAIKEAKKGFWFVADIFHFRAFARVPAPLHATGPSSYVQRLRVRHKRRSAAGGFCWAVAATRECAASERRLI